MRVRKYGVWLFLFCWMSTLGLAIAPEPDKLDQPSEDVLESSIDAYESSGSPYNDYLDIYDNFTTNVTKHALPGNCTEVSTDLVWKSPGSVVVFVILVMIDVFVIAGNILVIAAVFSSSKLRCSVNNLFIVSLAAADMCLGVMVLPFSLTIEVFETWPFGDNWCSMWLAVDVWMCTASIINLVVISFDRYIAVTRPVAYPSLMTKKKAKLLILGVWVLSFVICFPPLVGWNKEATNIVVTDTCQTSCTLTSELGYVLYSASGSFFIPMFVMMFFYYKIFLAASETTKAINQGFRTASESAASSRTVTLRIHRGTSSRGRGGSNARSSYTPVRKTNSDNSDVQKLYDDPSPIHKEGVELLSVDNNKPQARILQRNSLPDPRNSRNSTPNPSGASDDTSGAESSASTTNGLSQRNSSRMGRRNIKNQVKRFRMETKAAKTLGIIVGVFIMCWLPFFTMYLVMGFCDECINWLLFDILFWLGYCNSALNPLIYGLFSKDFREAFKVIICKCFCRKPRKRRIPVYVPSYDSEDGR